MRPNRHPTIVARIEVEMDFTSRKGRGRVEGVFDIEPACASASHRPGSSRVTDARDAREPF